MSRLSTPRPGRGSLSTRLPGTWWQEEYRAALLNVTDPLNALVPQRYKRFIRSGDTSHTSLRGDLFYTAEADGVPLYEWTDDFVNDDPGWVDIVEDFVPAP